MILEGIPVRADDYNLRDVANGPIRQRFFAGTPVVCPRSHPRPIMQARVNRATREPQSSVDYARSLRDHRPVVLDRPRSIQYP
jgi:hypothetical protein